MQCFHKIDCEDKVWRVQEKKSRLGSERIVNPEGVEMAAVAGRVAVNATILRPWLEETDSLGRGCHGRSVVIIATIYRVDSRFFRQKRA